jgi:CRP-like cAMP-binding protein
MDAAQLEQLALGTHQVNLPKGGILVNKGEMPDSLFIVLEGRIKISFISREGKEYIAEIFGPGQSFGEAVLFLDKPYPVTAQALRTSIVLSVSKTVILTCIDQCPNFSRKLIGGLCVRLADRIQALEFVTVYSSVQKVVGYLLREIEFIEPKGDSTNLRLSVNKATLAAHLDLTPETLSRVLHRLVDEGLLSVEGKVIRVRNIRKLRDYNG